VEEDKIAGSKNKSEEDWDVDNVWYVLAWRLHLITKKPSKGNVGS